MEPMEIQVKMSKPSSEWENAPFLLDLVSHLIDLEEEEGYNILRPITQARCIAKKGVETSIRLPTFGKCTRWTSVYPLPPPPFPSPLHGPVSLVFGKYPLTHLHWWRKALD